MANGKLHLIPLYPPYNERRFPKCIATYSATSLQQKMYKDILLTNVAKKSIISL